MNKKTYYEQTALGSYSHYTARKAKRGFINDEWSNCNSCFYVLRLDVKPEVVWP